VNATTQKMLMTLIMMCYSTYYKTTHQLKRNEVQQRVYVPAYSERSKNQSMEERLSLYQKRYIHYKQQMQKENFLYLSVDLGGFVWKTKKKKILDICILSDSCAIVSVMNSCFLPHRARHNQTIFAKYSFNRKSETFNLIDDESEMDSPFIQRR
jgi:hypothetical protein